MMARLESRYATDARMATEEIFALVSVRAFRGREPLAFDRNERIEIDMPATIDPDGRVARSWHKIDLPACHDLVGLFGPELQKIPS